MENKNPHINHRKRLYALTEKIGIDNLTDIQCVKLNVILDSDVSELQAIMQEAYEKTNKKQYRILANPNYSQFIELNLNELKGMV